MAFLFNILCYYNIYTMEVYNNNNYKLMPNIYNLFEEHDQVFILYDCSL